MIKDPFNWQGRNQRERPVYRISLLSSSFIALLCFPTIASADPAGDEARRQASMASASASAAAIDRRNSDAAFQAGLRQPSSPSGSSASSSSNSSTTSAGGLASSGAASNGPQSVVARRTYTVWVSETLPQAATRLAQEAAAGNAQSQYWLGRMNYGGYGVPINLVEARRLFVAAATQNHIEGMAYAGQFLVLGQGGPVDRTRGLSYLFEAAEANNAEAQAILGVQYMNISIETNNNARMPRAISYLERAAVAGNALAQTTLGTTIYYLGVGGVAVDGVKAVRYMRQAVAQGEPMSMYYLGNLMVNGDAWTGENRTDGWSLVSRAAQAGNGRAMWLLGSAKMEGSRGQAKNEAEGARLLRASAETGDRNGQYMWGQLLYFGAGVRENKAEGLATIRRSADQSQGEAQLFLAKSYHDGDTGITPNRVEAARWARLSAESGNSAGQSYFGRLLWTGDGVSIDKVAAARWIKKAADQRHPDAVSDMADSEVQAILRTLRD